MKKLFFLCFILLLSGCTNTDKIDMELSFLRKQTAELYDLNEKQAKAISINSDMIVDTNDLIKDEEYKWERLTENIYSKEIEQAIEIMEIDYNYGYCKFDGIFNGNILYFECETKYASTYRLEVNIANKTVTIL